MPVRNIGSIGSSGNIKPISGFVWIPPTDGSIYKIEVITNTTTYDVTTNLIEGEYTDGITQTIGEFSFKIDNSAEQYSNIFNIYDTVKVYMNYGATASVLKFTGLVERPSYTDNAIVLKGQGSAIRTTGKKITYSATNTARSTILIAIINKYFTGVIATTNIETDSELTTVKYEDKPFGEVIEDLCGAGGRDFYIDANFVANYFESGTRLNNTDAVVHESNLISTGDFSADLQGVVNRVKVYGVKKGNSFVLAKAEDTNSQAILRGDKRELIINDGNITTAEIAQIRADYELAKNKDPPIIGEITSLLLPTLSPGERIRISDPFNGINPTFYTIQKYTHIFSNDDPPQTTLTIQKERVSIPSILKRRIKFESESTEINNPNEMDYSIFYDFNTDIGTHSNTEIDEGLTILRGTANGGIWISPVTITPSNITGLDPRLTGSNISGVKIFVSLDGGDSYTLVIPQANTTLTVGNELRIKLTGVDTDTEIDALSILYRRN